MFQTWQEALCLIPSHMRDGVENYINHGIPPGDFALAILENDFMGACGRADWVNKQQLSSWGDFLLYCPWECYGSPGKVKTWISEGGLVRREKEIANG